MKNLTVIFLILLSLSACGQKFKKPVPINTKTTSKKQIPKHDYLVANKPNKSIRKFNVKKYYCSKLLVYIKPKPLK